MRVLLVETTQSYPASPLLQEALADQARERGWEHEFFDEAPFGEPLSKSVLHKVAFRILGRRPLTYWAFNRALIEKVRIFRPSITLIVKGAYVSPETLEAIKRESGTFLINYATDDPFNPRVNTIDLLKGMP